MQAIFQLRRNPGRVLGTSLTIAITGAAALLLVTSSLRWEQQVEEKHLQRGTDVLITRSGRSGALFATLDDAVLQRVRQLPGVKAAEPSAWDIFSTDSARPLGITAWPRDSYLWSTLELLDGIAPTSPALPPRAVFLGQGAAEVLQRKPGDLLLVPGNDLQEVSFQVAGILESPAPQESLMVFFFLSDFQQTLGQPGRFNLINVRLADGLNSLEIAALLEAMERTGRGVTAVRVADWTRNNLLRQAAELLAGIGALAAVLLLVPGLANSLLMHLQEHRQEVGLLLAVGWSRGRILAAIASLSLRLVLLGGFFAYGIFLLSSYYLSANPLIGHLFQAPLLPQAGPTAILLALLSALVSCVPSAWQLWHLQPSEALQTP